ncbi:NAD(P)/FAD-dependent oxidoreductase [Actinomycetospora lutea]|uniref:NAD(P)/FAD-dependent oxidoreductase n=1 Tax=Actinomycetospora lutea TaxID=663604 RepID=UPI002365C3E2|nr:NAD(P)/FAD-dependent oxidoreductase [Actinomycetospora lutea]MDD7942713.1 NAD(P)/FAD-dependent oxidoreductase [Actinomycetospora lutea]
MTDDTGTGHRDAAGIDPSTPGRPPKVVIVGSGFAGFKAARSLSRRMGDAVDIVVVSPTNYFLYLPLLPEVAAGILEPRRISVALAAALPACVRHAPGEVDELDLDERRIGWLDPEGVHHTTTYDRLVLAAGSVHKVLPVPGVTEYAQGFRGVPEALYLRDHLIRQVELAAMCDDPEERTARLTCVVVGAGYTGTEVAAQGQLFMRELARSRGLAEDPHWVLVSRGEVLAGLDEHLARTADRVLRERGVDVRTHEQMDEATGDGVRLRSGDHIPTRTLLWCVGVRPDPLIEELGIEVDQGRLVVDSHLRVPGHPEVFACGDAAAVPDRARPGEYTAMTAQHAERQGLLAGRNVAASLGHGREKAYKHRDLGFVVDLGGFQAAANPLGVKLTGKPAHVVARGYHLISMPGNRIRTAVDWTLDALLPRQTAQLGLVRSPAVPLDSASPEVPQHGLGFPHAAAPGARRNEQHAEQRGEERSEVAE